MGPESAQHAERILHPEASIKKALSLKNNVKKEGQLDSGKKKVFSLLEFMRQTVSRALPKQGTLGGSFPEGGG